MLCMSGFGVCSWSYFWLGAFLIWLWRWCWPGALLVFSYRWPSFGVPSLLPHSTGVELWICCCSLFLFFPWIWTTLLFCCLLCASQLFFLPSCPLHLCPALLLPFLFLLPTLWLCYCLLWTFSFSVLCHSQMHFLVWKCINFGQDFTEVCS